MTLKSRVGPDNEVIQASRHAKSNPDVQDLNDSLVSSQPDLVPLGDRMAK